VLVFKVYLCAVPTRTAFALQMEDTYPIYDTCLWRHWTGRGTTTMGSTPRWGLVVASKVF